MSTTGRFVATAAVLLLSPASVPDDGDGDGGARAAAETYANPVASGRVSSPSILKHGSTYYAYVDGFDFYLPFRLHVLTSPDLVNWTGGENTGLLPGGRAGDWADDSTGWNFGSTSVAHYPGNPADQRFVLYYTGVHKDTNKPCVGVAVSGSPEGPFNGRDTPLICPSGGAQDPSMAPGSALTPIPQLVYVRGDAIYNQVLSTDGQSLASGHPPRLLYKAFPTWWHNGIVERPAIVRDEAGDGIYLFFSGAAKNTAARATGWTPCRAGFGVVVSCRNQTRLGTWLAATDEVASPSGVQAFGDGSHQWLVYSALPGDACDGETCRGTPRMHIDRLCFSNDHPRTNGPTSDPEPLARAADCSDDVPGAELDPDNAEVTDEGTTSPLSRDGNRTGVVGGRTLWVFGDTFKCGPDSNSGAFGVPDADATGPEWMADPGNCPVETIQKTQAEKDFDDAHKDRQRIVHWPAGIIGLEDGSGVVFFGKTLNINDPDSGCGWCEYRGLGIGAVRISAEDIAAGRPAGDRDPSVSPGACTVSGGAGATQDGCLFDMTIDEDGGSAAFQYPLIVGDDLYLYSSDKVAQAPLPDFENRSAWRYWTGRSGAAEWSRIYADAAVIENRGNPYGDGGQVAYNAYLDRYVNYKRVLFDMHISTSKTPTGSWTPARPLLRSSRFICADEPDFLPWTRTHHAHTGLFMNGGRTLAASYYRPGDNDLPGCDGQLRWATIDLN